jgi:Dyp-type peroxidase, C-terminal
MSSRYRQLLRHPRGGDAESARDDYGPVVDVTMLGPYGVITGIVPFNWPPIHTAGKLAPADGGSAQPWFVGGTTMIVRRIRAEMDAWDELDRTSKEFAVGRRLERGALPVVAASWVMTAEPSRATAGSSPG